MVHKAVVLLSGGQDSTTALYWARSHLGEDVHAVSFRYGQRHETELEAATDIANIAEVSSFRVITVPDLSWQSALTNEDVPVTTDGGYLGLPSTYTPGRNIVFFSMAAALAANLGANHIVAGVCQTDFSGYPDCRRPFINAMQYALALGTDWPLIIHTPLMYLTKAETVVLANELGACWQALAYSVTCYYGQRPGCGNCPACVLRRKGFDEAGYEDPALDLADRDRYPSGGEV